MTGLLDLRKGRGELAQGPTGLEDYWRGGLVDKWLSGRVDEWTSGLVDEPLSPGMVVAVKGAG